MARRTACICLALLAAANAAKTPGQRQAALLQSEIVEDGQSQSSQSAIFAAGCFWGVELAFARLPAVLHTEVGYVGGTTKQPSYDRVSGGRTGHAEAVRVRYDPRRISFAQLVEAFFDVHDATQLNRQGNDVGTQYRSAIFYSTDEERAEAAAAVAAEAERSGRRIATSVEPAGTFWSAEEYHQQVCVPVPAWLSRRPNPDPEPTPAHSTSSRAGRVARRARSSRSAATGEEGRIGSACVREFVRGLRACVSGSIKNRGRETLTVYVRVGACFLFEFDHLANHLGGVPPRTHSI